MPIPVRTRSTAHHIELYMRTKSVEAIETQKKKTCMQQGRARVKGYGWMVVHRSPCHQGAGECEQTQDHRSMRHLYARHRDPLHTYSSTEIS